VGSWVEGGFGTEAFGSLRLAVTRVNRQPALANYVRKPGDSAYSPLALDVLRIAGKDRRDRHLRRLAVRRARGPVALPGGLRRSRHDDGAREHVVNAAAAVVHEDRQEAGEQR
jgi:hypothetical protein